MNDAMDVILRRSSVRSFLDREIGDDDWMRIMRAAMAAPSAVDRRPWDFLLIRSRETLSALARLLPYAKMTERAAGAVIACAVPERAFGGSREFAIIDTTLACENLLLAVDALGFGAVWTAVYPDPARQRAVRELLGIPDSVITLAHIPVGYPAEAAKPKDKFDPDRIHKERW